jgi:hypothetical protein
MPSSCLWSAPAAPVQHAAAMAFTEPAQSTERITPSRSLRATLAQAVASVARTAADRRDSPGPPIVGGTVPNGFLRQPGLAWCGTRDAGSRRQHGPGRGYHQEPACAGGSRVAGPGSARSPLIACW